MEPIRGSAGNQESAASRTETVVQDSNEIDNFAQDVDSAKANKNDSSRSTASNSQLASDHGDLKDPAAAVSSQNLESNEIEDNQEVVKVHNPGMVFKTGLYTKAYHSEYSDY